MKKLTLPEKLERFPPVVVRLLARTGRAGSVVAISDDDVARFGGLARREVVHLSKLTSWDHIEIATFLGFLKGCRADFDDRDWLRKNTAYMRNIRRLPRYLTRSPHWSSTFEPLIRIWVSTQQ
jgi:hypothetical protein